VNVNPLTSSYIQSLIGNSTPSTSGSSIDPSSLMLPGDGTPQLSPFAQMLSALQKIQQQDPSQYQQLTQQIATNLQSAAQTAQADGNTTQAVRLSQLSTDFQNASASGQLPNFKDLAQAVGGHHHHHHHAAPSGDDSSSTNNALSIFAANSTQNDALNPVSIISKTLSDAGVSTSNA